LLSVRFSLKNFFAFFISMMMMMKMRFILMMMKMRFILEKETCFDSKRELIISLKIR
jgi:hypothetical protein